MARPTVFAPSFCYVCGHVAGTPEARTAHMAEAHPGIVVRWRARRPWITGDGPDRQVSPRQIMEWRAVAMASGMPPLPQHPRTGVGGPSPARRRFTSISGGAPKTDRPVETEPPAEPSVPRPTIIQPAIRLSPQAAAEQTRETVKEALTERVLAELVRELSVALSDADGAGEAGHLNMIQATQIAHLLYDSTVDVIVDRFRGNVTRFKLAAAIFLILIAKGRVHAQAIARRVREGRAGVVEPDADWSADETAPEPGTDWQADAIREETAAPDPIADLARRQREWAEKAAASG